MATKKKLFITGGSGNLGTALRKLDDFDAPNIEELDVTDLASCRRAIRKYEPDIIIHAAAYVDVAGAETNQANAWKINVVGTQNMAIAAQGRRLVFISTDYVFDGQKGDYKEDDTPNPVNYYALTKLAGEDIIRQYGNTLIIRTAFKPDGSWKYPKAFVDQWVSHDFVSKIAPDILKASLMIRLKGVIHIAGTRKTVYELAKKVSPNVGKMNRKDAGVRIPKDTSLNQAKWKAILSKQRMQKK